MTVCTFGWRGSRKDVIMAFYFRQLQGWGISRPSGWERIETFITATKPKQVRSISRPSGWERIETPGFKLITLTSEIVSPDLRVGSGLKPKEGFKPETLLKCISRPSGWERIETSNSSSLSHDPSLYLPTFGLGAD